MKHTALASKLLYCCLALNISDRTLSLLKAGAKACSQKLNTSDQENSIELSSPRPPHKFKSNLKQMLLTNKLQLQASDKVVNVISIHKLQEKIVYYLQINLNLILGCPNGSLWMLSSNKSIHRKQMLLLWSDTLFLLFVYMCELLRIVLPKLFFICVSYKLYTMLCRQVLHISGAIRNPDIIRVLLSDIIMKVISNVFIVTNDCWRKDFFKGFLLKPFFLFILFYILIYDYLMYCLMYLHWIFNFNAICTYFISIWSIDNKHKRI